MGKELDRFVRICNLKYKLKNIIKSLGFEDKNGTLFVRPNEIYDTNFKFDDEVLLLWNNEKPARKISRNYNVILEDIDDNIYEAEEFIEGLLTSLINY